MPGFSQPTPGEFTRTASNAIYSRQAIATAQSAFKAHCSVTIRPQGAGLISVTVKPIGEASRSPEQAVLEFWNYVLDSEAQRRLDLE
jgi:hypothetical protein